MKNITITSVVCLLLLSCSSPLNKKYNEETLSEDAKEIKEKGGLTEEDAQTLAGWIVRAKLNDKKLDNKTYREILMEAKDYKNEQDLLAKKAKLEEEEKKQRLGATLTVAMYDKGYQEYDYQKFLTYSLAFENKSQKDIRAFKGSLTINDLFDSEIKSINLTIDEPIAAGEIHRGTYTSDYNRFMDEDTRLRNKEMDDLKIVWIPEKIIFEDGTTLE